MGVSSYGAGTESGDLVFHQGIAAGRARRDVLLVTTILDTGKTMSRVLPKIACSNRAASNLRAARQAQPPTEGVEADYVASPCR